VAFERSAAARSGAFAQEGALDRVPGYPLGAMPWRQLLSIWIADSVVHTWIWLGRISLIGIDEPEIALHPAAAGVLFDALTEASERVQVLVTSQSPDLLDRDDLDVSDVARQSTVDLRVPAPAKVHRGRLVAECGIERAVSAAAQRGGVAAGGVLVLLDADDDCPAELGPRNAGTCAGSAAGRPGSVVLANREFEAWCVHCRWATGAAHTDGSRLATRGDSLDHPVISTAGLMRCIWIRFTSCSVSSGRAPRRLCRAAVPGGASAARWCRASPGPQAPRSGQ
jgi:hypothetical protein